jgi:plastocyanin
MRIHQFRPLALALSVITAAGLAVPFAAAQPMPGQKPAPRPTLPAKPAMQPAAPAAAANAAANFSAARFGHVPFDMMMRPGMPMQPMYGMGSMGYGMGSMAGNSGYGAQGAEYQQDGSGYGAPAMPSSEEKSVSQILTATGLPNDGRLQWPVGLRVVGGGAADELREQIDALLREEAGQARVGPANANFVEELGRAVKELRGLFVRERDERGSLPLTTYEDAERFLGKLDHAQKMLAAGLEPAGEKARLETREGKAAEVGLSDNRFDPPTLTVPAGTTVRWVNRGQHKHTVTADKGDWGSKELAPEAVYEYTFTQPGTYTYHCEVHPKEMRGTVIVK